ncbi:MAG: hypothetical protein R3C59_20460 [Planctomycetaceae bacterium]
MNARVLLLMLVTGLLMAAWDGDKAAMQTALAKRDQQRQQQIAAAGPNGQSKSVPISTVFVIQQDVADDAVPLPAGITAGSYQAVSSNGTTVRIEVPQNANGTDRDFYTVDAVNGDRWYLIRVIRN